MPNASSEIIPATLSQWTADEIEALCLSAQHWLENYQDPARGTFSSLDCACCTLAADEYGYACCWKCPIGKTMAADDCQGTPYGKARQEILSARAGNTFNRNRIAEEYTFIVSVLLKTR